MSTKAKRRGKTGSGGRAGNGARVDALGATSSIFNMLGMHAGIATEFERPLPELKRIESGIKYWMALHLIKTYTHITEVTWMPLCEAVNIGMILCERGIGGPNIELFFDAQDAIVRAWTRAGAQRAARFDGPGMVAIARALEIHDVQLRDATRGDLARAEREMIRRSRENNHVDVEAVAKAA